MFLQIRRGLGWLALSFTITGLTTSLRADDWPQWMGPTRDGEYRETGIFESFPEEGLKVQWRQPIAGGYGGPAVSQGRVVVMDYAKTSGEVFNNPGQRAELQGKERIHCFDAKTGAKLWTHAYDCPYAVSYPVGPRCTPSIDGDDVITLGSEGHLKCLSLETGEVRWEVNFKDDLAAETPIWGHSAHPLIDGNQVICMVGGDGQTVVAFDRADGSIRWQALDASGVGYCPPSIFEAGGVRQLLVWHADGIESLDPKDGKVHWTVPLKPQYEMAICKPQLSGDLLYVSGIGSKSVMLKLSADAPAVTELWSGGPKSSLYGGNATPIFHGEMLYGSDCQLGAYFGVSAVDGERLWQSFEPTRKGEERRISHGTAFTTHIAGTDRYLLFSELGDLILARLSPDGYEELGRDHVIEPTQEAFGRSVIWSHPAYASQSAFVRNDKEIIAVSLAP